MIAEQHVHYHSLTSVVRNGSYVPASCMEGLLEMRASSMHSWRRSRWRSAESLASRRRRSIDNKERGRLDDEVSWVFGTRDVPSVTRHGRDWSIYYFLKIPWFQLIQMFLSSPSRFFSVLPFVTLRKCQLFQFISKAQIVKGNIRTITSTHQWPFIFRHASELNIHFVNISVHLPRSWTDIAYSVKVLPGSSHGV